MSTGTASFLSCLIWGLEKGGLTGSGGVSPLLACHSSSTKLLSDFSAALGA